MKFTKLVFHEKNWPDVFGRTLTLNLDKRELELQRLEDYPGTFPDFLRYSMHS